MGDSPSLLGQLRDEIDMADFLPLPSPRQRSSPDRDSRSAGAAEARECRYAADEQEALERQTNRFRDYRIPSNKLAFSVAIFQDIHQFLDDLLNVATCRGGRDMGFEMAA